MYYYGFDWTYVVLVMPAVIFALWAQVNVKSSFNKYSRVPSERGMTGADAARMILDQNGLRHIRIEPVQGSLTDHYDPKADVIRLSESTYNARTAAAVGVAAHEAGHAVQHATGYTPLLFRQAIIPITQIGSNLAFPLVILGLVLSFMPLAYVGIILFAAVTLFQLITLPVEFNASRRAMSVLGGGGYLSDEGKRAAGKVLRAAALTYVAALAVSLANLLRLVIMVNGRRKD